MTEQTTNAYTAQPHSLYVARLAPVEVQNTKAAKDVTTILLGLCLTDFVLENGYRADLHNKRQRRLGKSGWTGRYKPLHVHCQDNKLCLWVGEHPHRVWVQFGLNGGQLVYEDSVVCDGSAEWRLPGQEHTITNHWRQAGYGDTQWTRVQVLS